MEVPSLIPGNDEKRRKDAMERRKERHRQHSCRRNHHDRRYDRLGRFLISVLHKLGLHRLEKEVVTLAERRLLAPLITFFSAIVFFLLYSGEKGAEFAGVILFALMIHEFGHFFATKFCSLRPHWWWFWPFLGALMRLPSIKSRNHEAVIALGGPLLGGVCSALIFKLWLLFPNMGYKSHLIFHFAFNSTLINLFNLIPISPLDGGRITQASFRWFQLSAQWFGIAILLALSWFTRQPTLLLVWIVVVIDRFIDFPLWRIVLTVILLVVMSIMLYLGYGHVTSTEGISFLCFGALLVVMCRPNEEAYLRRQRSGKHILPMLSVGMRFLWMVTWICIAGALYLLFDTINEYGMASGMFPL